MHLARAENVVREMMKNQRSVIAGQYIQRRSFGKKSNAMS